MSTGRQSPWMADSQPTCLRCHPNKRQSAAGGCVESINLEGFMEIVDGQLHANQFGPNWKTVGLEATLLATIIAMDAVGVKAAVLDEYVGQDKNFNMLPGHYEANGAYRPERPFSELAMHLSRPIRLGKPGRSA